MSRPFDPVYHQNVVNNYRTMFKEKYGKDCKLTDGKIWTISEVTFAPTSAEQDEWVLEEMFEESR